MGILVDLPAPSCNGVYFALVEPDVVKISSSTCISRGVSRLRSSTFRVVALLAWTNRSEQYVHGLFVGERITLTREFFRVSSDLLHFINECRLLLGFQEIEEILLWQFGGPLPRERVSRPRKVAQVTAASQVSPEESSRRGRYYTHLRWHKNRSSPSCEFCAQSEGHQ
jgi:hypothetical protein